ADSASATRISRSTCSRSGSTTARATTRTSGRTTASRRCSDAGTLVLVPSAARLFALGALWRGAAVESAGRALVDALASGDQNLRTIAGMMLVKAGPRSAPLLRDAVARGKSRPMALRVLGDLGDPESETTFRTFERDPDPAVAAAARDGLRALGSKE